MQIQFIDNGNLSSWLQLLLVGVGVGTAASAIYFDFSVIWARVLLLLGFAIALVGGMASRAKLLKIRPFDNGCKKARDSYRVK
ncbi:hypothetical protein [Pandoraea sp. PE-S2R-1]|uniref:hypothetical protein n=1 Tax=Pandoraea sp. PE-S2R-1 TaxID=1986994 RepID=UPI000B3FDC82|nr:hypothetical protein [Pandoraea sp. PE-S2R-1]